MIKHSMPIFDDGDFAALASVLREAFVTNGEKARQFGRMLARITGRNWGIPVQSGTDALVLALKSMKLPSSAKIAIPAYACGAILDAVTFLRMKAVPLDISLDNLGISVNLVNENKFDAVIAAHLFGIASPFYKIKEPNLIEDCAQCLGISIAGRKLGSMGRLSLSSFYGTKILSTGHGGVLCGDDKKYFDNAMRFLLHDKVDKWQEHLHFLMSDLNASLGISQAKKLRTFIKKRREIARIYLDALGEKTVLPDNEMFFRFTVIPLCISLEAMIAKFANAGIEVKKPVYKPIFRLLKLSPRNFPKADWADKKLISIPIYPAMKDNDIAKVADFLRRHKDEICCRTSA